MEFVAVDRDLVTESLPRGHHPRLLANDLSPGSEGASLLPELGPEPADLVVTRFHGVGPMGGADSDPNLRNLGVTTIVAVGVSVNIAIPNLIMDAVNAADQVGTPSGRRNRCPEGVRNQVIDNSLSLLATLTSTQELIEIWAAEI